MGEHYWRDRLLDTSRRLGATRRPGADLGTPPSVNYRTISDRRSWQFLDDDAADRRGGRRDGRSRARAGGRRGRAKATGRTPSAGGAQASGRRSSRRRRRNVVVPVAVVAIIAVA